MKAILLVRVSTEQQELDEQTLSLKRYALTKGYKENDLYLIEDKESAIKLSEDERNGLIRMKEIISKDKDVNAVFVWELSRLTRIPKTAYSLREFFINNHIQLYCYSPTFQLLNDDLVSINSQGSMTFAIFIELAEAEMRTKKERFHRSKVRNARTGKYSGGFIKFGYKLDAKGFYQIDEDKALLVRYIFNEYEKGKSIFKLSKELHERGKINSQNFVRGILISECYTGFSNQYNMERQYPQIISKEQFEKCRQIAKENDKRADKTSETYYCKNIIKCVECGTHYYAIKASGAYVCYGRYGKEAKFDKSKACKNSPMININLLDSIIWEIAKDEEFNYGTSSKEMKIKELEGDIKINIEKIETAKKNINALVPKIEKSNLMYDNNTISEAKYIERIENIKNEERRLKNSIVKYENENELKERILRMTISEIKSDNIIDILNEQINDIDNIIDDVKRQEICRRWIKEINIHEVVPNKTKLIHVFLKREDEILIKVDIKKKAPKAEYYYKEPHGFIEPIWRKFEYEFIERFSRRKNKPSN